MKVKVRFFATFREVFGGAEKEIDLCIEAVDDSLSELRPYIEEIWPDLISTGF